jgi:Holliday junction resolvasome RuvABC endonuclease subunit
MTLIKSAARIKAKSVIGIDASTNSFGYAILDKTGPVEWGKIMLTGSTIVDRFYDAKIKTRALASRFDKLDYGAVEASVMVRSISVAIKLAYFDSVITAELLDVLPKGATLVNPSEWQSFIGNQNYTRQQKQALRKQFPGRSASWYNNEVRRLRKQFTIDYFNKMYKINLDDDDVADAMGVAYWASKVKTRR